VAQARKKGTGGIDERHQKECPAYGKDNKRKRCRCTPSYRAEIQFDGERYRATFRDWSEADSWLVDMRRKRDLDLVGGKLERRPLAIVAAEVFARMRSGQLLNDDRDRYDETVILNYEAAFGNHIKPLIGTKPIDAITFQMLDGGSTGLVQQLREQGLAPSTISNAVKPLRVIFRDLVRLGKVLANPTRGIELERGHAVQVIPTSVAHVMLLLAALRDGRAPQTVLRDDGRRVWYPPLEGCPLDVAIWACAFFAGLRLGEIAALDWSAVDFDENVIHVRRQWDQRRKVMKPPKGKKLRDVPMLEVLREILLEYRRLTGKNSGLLFGDSAGKPFNPSAVARRAKARWHFMEHVGLHQARHTFASILIAAGVNAKILSTVMGHSSIEVTFDVYGHLFKGAEAEAAALVNRWMADRLADDGLAA
jgi:integrase